MERRGCSLGCVVALLGLTLGCCLLPHLTSSIYSVVTSLLETPVASKWLWGDWISTLSIVQNSKTAYMVLAEGPICCAGVLALLILILGMVVMITGFGRGETYEEETSVYED